MTTCQYITQFSNLLMVIDLKVGTFTCSNPYCGCLILINDIYIYIYITQSSHDFVAVDIRVTTFIRRLLHPPISVWMLMSEHVKSLVCSADIKFVD